MARLSLKARYPKRFKVTTDSNHNETIPPNSLDRQFDVVAPNQVWTTDNTYIWTLEGWLYWQLAVIYFRGKKCVGLLHATCGHYCEPVPLQMAFW